MKKKSKFFYLQLCLTLLVCAFLIVPVILSVTAGLTANYIVGVRSGITLQWFGKVWELYRDTIFRSIMIGLVCLGCTLILGIPAAYVMVKRQNRFTRIFEELLVTPLAIPGLATALALIVSYGRFTDFRKSWLFILAGHVVFTLPFMVRSVIAVMNSANTTQYEEGAASLGAGFWHRFFHIVIPVAMPGILAGSLMVFTLSIGEFNLTWMLHTPTTKTLPVGLADSYASMRLEIGSAYTIAFFIMIIPLLIAMQWVAKPPRKRAVPEKTELLTDPRWTTEMKKNALERNPILQEDGRESVLGTSLRLENCSKTFPDGTQALKPFSLSVKAGETVVILGPSGCGKTTMLRIIAGLETPDPPGRVFFGDEDVTELPIEKRNVGMVFQSYALFPNMNVEENIAYGLKVRGLKGPQRERRVSEMLEMMKITELRNRTVDQLSGGQKQRVALARAIAVRPRLLLMDEPLTALDAKLRDVLRAEIDSLLRSLGITAIYVTHDQAEAMALGDRIVVMEIAKISQVGTPQEIYFKPQNRFVADFIGTLNRILGRVEGNYLAVPGGAIPLEGVSHLHLRPGQEVEIFFRPEHGEVVGAAQGTFKATVAASFFMGDHTRLLLEWTNASYLTIEAKSNQVFRKGDQVEIRIDPASLLTLRT